MWYDNNGTVYSTNHQICLKTFKYPNRKIKLIFNNFTRRHADPNLCGGPLDPDFRIADRDLNPVPLIMFWFTVLSAPDNPDLFLNSDPK